LDVERCLRSSGRETVSPDAARDALFAADASVTEVADLIAETGSLVIAAGPHMTRSESLIVPLHIAIARPEQLVPDVFDLFERFSPTNMPASNLVLITGPSKTGDIEMKLVTGVHGPGEVHVLILRTPV
jgi:L-lactate utilization protein LutC